MLILDTGKNLECIRETVETGNCHINITDRASYSNLDLTIIIPSHNRHDYIQFSINYYRLFGIKCIYIDSSNSQFEFNECWDNIQYIHLPGYSFSEKMIYALERVNTNFICTCADDDFLIIDELMNGCKFLQQHPKYVLYFGIYWSYIQDNNSFMLKKKTIVKKKRNINGDKWARSYTFFSKYENVLWSLSKKDVLLKGFQLLNKTNYKNHNFYELVLGTNFCFYGNILISNNLWLVRESNDESWGRQHQNLVTINKSRSFKEDFQSFIDTTNSELCHGFGSYSYKMYSKFVYKRKILSVILKPFNVIKKILYLLEKAKN